MYTECRCGASEHTLHEPHIAHHTRAYGTLSQALFFLTISHTAYSIKLLLSDNIDLGDDVPVQFEDFENQTRGISIEFESARATFESRMQAMLRRWPLLRYQIEPFDNVMSALQAFSCVGATDVEEVLQSTLV